MAKDLEMFTNKGEMR